jgi:aminoglycoside/choline kinase family phosphotransferase
LDKRKQIIRNWIESLYPNKEYSLDLASSDASFRRYFRLLIGNSSQIIMDAPPENEEITTFCRLARRFHSIGINVPEIQHTDYRLGLVLMSDLGSEHYLDHLNEHTADDLYGDALDSLVILQKGTFDEPGFLPPYSSDLLHDEMDLFRQWYLTTHLGLEITDEENKIMDKAWQLLIDSAMEQPQRWVHRDYHSRNLMLTAIHNPGVIDFQDAVTGPITYDLVSLLKDCYIEWPIERVEDWVLGYHDLAIRSGLLEQVDKQQFLCWFHRMGIQRHLKVAGIFARLSHRDGKHRYLNDIPLTLKYLLTALNNDPNLKELYDLVASRVAQ